MLHRRVEIEKQDFRKNCLGEQHRFPNPEYFIFAETERQSHSNPAFAL
jgi:hypothetical protein